MKTMIDDLMKDRIEKWLESLNEKERSQVELLDAYFTFRRNLPSEEENLGKPAEDHKTTDEIIDDLSSMMLVEQSVVVGWMRNHNFHITTIADGTVKWAIWRFLKF